jgi:hypothetical protein
MTTLNSDYFDFIDHSTYPKLVSWLSPEDGNERNRILRNQEEETEFFSWFSRKYPNIETTIK